MPERSADPGPSGPSPAPPGPPPPASKRHESTAAVTPTAPRFALALRAALKGGYSRADLRADLLAGTVVGIVALPLSMALAIASGVPPQHGLYTAIVSGALSALLGGSPTQVSGPTAAFVVILAPISARFGLGGLLVATMIAGVILLALGAVKLGRLIQYIPHPVTTGFTSGIAVVIATLQLKDFLGLQVARMPEHYLERLLALGRALPTARMPDLVIGAGTLAVLLLWPRVSRKLPSPLVGLAVAGLAAYALSRLIPGFSVATIGSRFSYAIAGGGVGHGIPQLPPLPVLPWHLPGPEGQPLVLSLDLVRQLLPPAFAIAMLGAIESLLSAVVSDGMAGTKHDPDGELLGQGVANLLSPFLGGFASTGAIARTATNIRSGARSPIAAITHAVVVLLAVLLLAPLLAYLPMAALAALLFIVAYNMSEVKHFMHVLRVAPKSDVMVLLACFFSTVIFDMVVAVTLGVVLASLLFMRRMAEISGTRLVDHRHEALKEPLPDGVVLYEIAGPLFFGAAQKAMSALDAGAGPDLKNRVVILDIEGVPAMDATGLVNLESSLGRLARDKAFVILAGIQEQPARVLERAGIGPVDGQLAMCDTLDEAVARARVHIEQTASRSSRPPRQGA